MLVCLSAGVAQAEKKKKKDEGDGGCQWWSTPAACQDADVRRLAPRSVDTTPAVAPAGQVRTIRLRIYADRDYRGVVIRWQAQARGQIQRINAIVGAVFNVRFEVESFREWERSHVGVPLGNAMLDELEALDDGTQVDLVLGLVTPFHGVAASMHAIGWAAYLSRHFVLRGMDDEQEFRAFEREFNLVPAQDRARLYTERKAHKEIVVFLHEWGHMLGLIHHEERTAIMNPAYDPRQTEFSDYDKRILALVIERRLAAREARNPESADLLPLVSALPAGEGSDADRKQLVDLVRRRVEDAARPVPANAIDLPAADIAAFNRAVDTLNSGQAVDAWKALSPLVEHTRERKLDRQTWVRIADLEAAIGALTEADAAAGRAGAAPEAQKISASIESIRHRVALPLDAAKLGVPSEQEPAYVAGFWETSKLVDGGDVAAARARLGEMAVAFPASPAIEVLTCDLELKAKHLAIATKHCEAALAKFKGATRAHILQAAIAFSMRKGPVGEQHLRQAILLDPADPTAWRMLARFYRSTHASRQLAALENQHKELLSSPLPE
jgi:predicted Zn-dependent protease